MADLEHYLGITLQPWQRRLVDHVLAGHHLALPSGRISGGKKSLPSYHYPYGHRA